MDGLMTRAGANDPVIGAGLYQMTVVSRGRVRVRAARRYGAHALCGGQLNFGWHE